MRVGERQVVPASVLNRDRGRPRLVPSGAAASADRLGVDADAGLARVVHVEVPARTVVFRAALAHEQRPVDAAVDLDERLDRQVRGAQQGGVGHCGVPAVV